MENTQENFHGVRTRRNSTPLNTPVVTRSGVTFAVGTAPVHTVDGVHIMDGV